MEKQYVNALFINYGGIGDEILFLPTLAAFKKENPNCRMTLALEPRSKSIAELTDLIDDVVFVDIKAEGIKKYLNILKFIVSLWFKKFDIVISSGKSPLVSVILFLTGIPERIGYKSKTKFLLTKSAELDENQYAARMYFGLLKPLEIKDYSDPEIKITQKFKGQLPESYIALHPGVSAMSVAKNILKCPNTAFWLGLIKELLNKGKTVVLLGGRDDGDLIGKILSDREIAQNQNLINCFNKTKNIAEMAYIMDKSESVICVDSAPMHVALALGKKTYAIFGPTNENKLVPQKESVTIIKNNIQCRPCLWHKRNQNCEKSECLNIDYRLIADKIN